MKIEQIYTKCLAQGSYYIESDGIAAIIDPLRESSPYLKRAKKNNTKIKYVFETHIHADFVSGHLDLAKKTGATIVFGPNANTNYDCHNASDGEIFKIGSLKLKVIHTPGHTLESVSYLLIDSAGNNHAIFTGDTLFLGDVGIPDVAQQYKGMSKENLAEMLFDSLRTKIMPLEDHVILYPAHGAGSACGKNMSKETVGKIGEQKRSNYALRDDMSKEEFVNEVLDGIGPPPAYFIKNIMLNKMGYTELDEILSKSNTPIDVKLFEELAQIKDNIILDVRSQQEFIKGHIPNSIFIGLNGSFAPWVGALISDINQPILLVVPEGRAEEAIIRLARVGYEKSLGYLEGGINSWIESGKSTEQITSISAKEFELKFENNNSPVLDVRTKTEYNNAHLYGNHVQLLSLESIHNKIGEIDIKKTYHIYCGGGYRSIIAASILKRNGFSRLIDVSGGFSALKETQLSMVAGKCN
ncbi:MAG: MBL fold metallo-hydrolase [Flavobacteriaceae bacterium]|nr:MBL fold metallo-hydrolase [Flavobacteriaceae bacterium]|tara:strand:+ start:31916 stop:33322 length:1407 start_codon:yes stop_codon:yes gene_type:complete